MDVPNNTHEETPTGAGESTHEYDHPETYLHSLRERLSALGCETVIYLGSLIAISPHANENGVRLADTISIRRRPDDEGRLWFMAYGNKWIEEIEKVPDAAMKIGASLKIGTEA